MCGTDPEGHTPLRAHGNLKGSWGMEFPNIKIRKRLLDDSDSQHSLPPFHPPHPTPKQRKRKISTCVGDLRSKALNLDLLEVTAS